MRLPSVGESGYHENDETNEDNQDTTYSAEALKDKNFSIDSHF